LQKLAFFVSQAKPVGVGALCQQWIPTVEQSGLLTPIATESVSLCVRMKKLTAFMELEAAIRACGELS